MQTSTHDLRALRHGSTGVITLDRPAKINALTPGMVRDITAVLDEWERDENVHLIVFEGAGARGFCAGGDIAFVRQSALARDGLAEIFWAEEYRLVDRIARLGKPAVAFMTGIVMGGGVGLCAHTGHRIVTESTRLAMPEAGIGLIPDVGATWLFSRAPGEFGTYLALTGAAIGAADAVALDLADSFVPEAKLELLKEALVLAAPRTDVQVDAIFERFAAPPGGAVLGERRALIDSAFAYDSVEDIFAALRSNGCPFALATAREISMKSPTSLKLTLRALREARKLESLQDCLRLEYRLMRRLIGGHDLGEGVRAAVVDKDRRPKWNPAELGDISPSIIDEHFASLGPQELSL